MDLRGPFSSPHGTPFKLRGFQPYQSRRSFGAHLCDFWDFQVSRSTTPNSDCILFYFGRHRRPPRISLGAAWATKDHFGGILSFSGFSRNLKIAKHRFFSVSRDSFRRNSWASMRDRGPAIFQPLVYSTTVFCYWSFHGWRLAGVSLEQFVNNAMNIDGFI